MPDLTWNSCKIFAPPFKTSPVNIALIGCYCDSKNKLATVIDTCESCLFNSEEMSTIGHSAFAACKVRENRQKTLQRIQAMEEYKATMYNINYNMEYTPMKYNSKLMNSIWGMYNRYSVHNLKKIMDDASPFVAASQQTYSVGSAATVSSERSHGEVKTATKTPTKQLLPNFWAPSEYSY